MKALGWFFGLSAAAFLAVSCASHSPTTADSQHIEVYYSATGGITGVVVKDLERATNNVLVQTYNFNSVPLANALLAAHARGVNVQVIVDQPPGEQADSQADVLADAGIPVWIDRIHAKSPSNLIIMDDFRSITHPFQYASPGKNSSQQGIQVVTDKASGAIVARRWWARKDHCDPYVARARK